MWICLNDCFVSIVAKGGAPGSLMVRARRRGDLERLFPGVEVTERDGTDYEFRTVVSADEVVRAVSGRILGVDYSNFKSSVTDDDLHGAYMGVWSVMNRLQEWSPFGDWPNRYPYQGGLFGGDDAALEECEDGMPCDDVGWMLPGDYDPFSS